MQLRTNEGYIITDSIHIGEHEFVMGVNTAAPAMYVTWKYSEREGYYWGHYTTDQMEATRDLLERASEELELIDTRRKEEQEQEAAR